MNALRRLLALALAAAPLLAAAEGADDDWLGSAAARSFRQRVIDLALLYDTASGIDPRGLRVEAVRTGRDAAGCPQVEVTTLRAGTPVRRETVAACPAAAEH